jgi:ribosomal protein S18 acetylase RimI-like enzyme
LLFCDLPPEERERRVNGALGLIRSGELDANGIIIERTAGQLAGVLVCLPVAGASALFWPPRSTAVAGAAGEDRLLARGLQWVRNHGAKLAQSLLTEDESHLAASLLRNGFSHITRLWYLASEIEIPVELLSVPTRLEFQIYDPERPDVLHATLLRTYEGTRDCPEINGVRTIQEVIAGHRAQGAFKPARWSLALMDGRPIGVLLMADMPDSGARDVAYVGIVPEARRRGFGRELMLKALFDARGDGVRRVTLSVDARNEPALQLYRGLGFVPYDRREVYLAI